VSDAGVTSHAAERRQITVLFCDLVNSAAMSQRFDPEDWREILREYQTQCADAVRRFDGHVAQYLGDGLLVYFGYPVAHEDDPQRAIRAALSVVQAVSELNPRLKASHGVALQVRVGIHTGSVVVGEIGDAERKEFLAVGETPNLAARIQGAAQASSVVVSEATYLLTKGYFSFRGLGALSLRGFSSPTRLYEVERDPGVRSRLDVAAAAGLTPFVGRAEELAFLWERWREACDGKARVVIVSGEPGIGKSRLLRTHRQKVGAEAAIVVECYGSPLFQGTVLHPVLEMIERHLGFVRETASGEKLAKLRTELEGARIATPENIALLAALLSIPLDATVAPLGLSPQRQREATFDALIAWLRALATQRPVLFSFEDIQWADPSSLELLRLIIERTPLDPLMLLLTHRPGFTPPWTSPRLSQLVLPRMALEDMRKIMEGVLNATPLPEDVVREVLTKAEGVPLYVEEITKAVLESSAHRVTEQTADQAPPSDVPAIPSTVRDSLTARLDRLGSGKMVVQLAATLGRHFTFEVLQAVSGIPAPVLRTELDRLVASELLFRTGPPLYDGYTFKHALIQDAAYASLLRSARQTYHHQIARSLIDRFPETSEAQPELVAYHYAAAQLNDPAAKYWGLAGQRAIASSAYFEAIRHFGNALEHLSALPPSPQRSRREVDLRASLGVALMTTQGFASRDVEETYSRAAELCEELGTELPLRVVYGVWAVNLMRSILPSTRLMVPNLERVAQEERDPASALIAHAMLETWAFWRGDYAKVAEHYAGACRFCDTQQPKVQHETLLREYGFEGLLYPQLLLAWSQALKGDPEGALRAWRRGTELADAIADPYLVTQALAFGAAINHDLGHTRVAGGLADQLRELTEKEGYLFWKAGALAIRGYAMVVEGYADTGIAKIKEGLELYGTVGSKIPYPYYSSYLAEAYLLTNRADEALEVLDLALRMVRVNVDCNYEPGILRLIGEAQLAQRRLSPARESLEASVAQSRTQGARLLELRAATSLARVLREQGEANHAKEVLKGVRAKFADAIDLPALHAADEVLLQL
jgi:class 3 adenylate cyclase/tetratricopeptide (TPR) repeat protein